MEDYLRAGINSDLRPPTPSADQPNNNFDESIVHHEQPSSILSLSNHMMMPSGYREDSGMCLVDDLFGSDNNPYMCEGEVEGIIEEPGRND